MDAPEPAPWRDEECTDLDWLIQSVLKRPLITMEMVRSQALAEGVDLDELVRQIYGPSAEIENI